MLSKIFHWLMGYAQFEVEGQTARFLNIAVKSSLTIWNLQKKEGKAVGYIRAREYHKLRGISKRCSSKLRCRKKRGLPFYLYRFGRRKGLVIGGVAAVALYIFLSGAIWSVKVDGLQDLTPARVLSAAKESGIYEGAKKNSFNAAVASVQMKALLPEISWISVNTDGCKVEIKLKESDIKPDFAGGDTPSNLVAERDGVIRKIEAQSGMKRVSIGETVQKGQLLISGVYTENISPYIQKQAPVKSYVLRARGSVVAETARNYEITIPSIKTLQVETGQNSNSYLLFFGIKIPLGLHTYADENAMVYEEEEKFKLLGQELPVGIRKEKYVFYEEKKIQLTGEEMQKMALYQLRETQKKELDENDKITEEQLDYTFTDTECTLKAVCRIEEEIGVEEQVLWNITDSDEIFYK